MSKDLNYVVQIWVELPDVVVTDLAFKPDEEDVKVFLFLDHRPYW